jgi:hypothetical protein
VYVRVCRGATCGWWVLVVGVGVCSHVSNARTFKASQKMERVHNTHAYERKWGTGAAHGVQSCGTIPAQPQQMTQGLPSSATTSLSMRPTHLLMIALCGKRRLAACPTSVAPLDTSCSTSSAANVSTGRQGRKTQYCTLCTSDGQGPHHKGVADSLAAGKKPCASVTSVAHPRTCLPRQTAQHHTAVLLQLFVLGESPHGGHRRESTSRFVHLRLANCKTAWE